MNAKIVYAQVEVVAHGGENIRTGIERLPRTFEVCVDNRKECERKALALYGDYSRVNAYREFDRNYPPIPRYLLSEEEEEYL
jgi:hypothetical protein